jgi:hypothetical protein
MNDSTRNANRVIDQRVEGVLDSIREIRADLDRLEAEATAIDVDGISAPQFSCSVGGGSMNVDVRKFAELDSSVQVINALRTVVALAE